jgi:signal peptide peptidase SppA
MWPFSRGMIVPVLRMNGPIGMATPLRPGLSLGAVAGALEKAFQLSKVPSVAVLINSPGGSPVQSSLIFKRIRQLADEHEKKVYVFCEDVAASGGYYLAIAGDEIYADTSSIIGSIGVISQSFGFVEAIKKIGVERRVYTAGENKSTLDPFLPENPDDVVRIKAIQRDIHDVFIGLVKERRAGKLKGPDQELFSGAFWSGPKAAADPHAAALLGGAGLRDPAALRHGGGRRHLPSGDDAARARARSPGRPPMCSPRAGRRTAATARTPTGCSTITSTR